MFFIICHKLQELDSDFGHFLAKHLTLFKYDVISDFCIIVTAKNICNQ